MLLYVEYNCMKQPMEPTPPGDGEVMNETVVEKEERNQGRKKASPPQATVLFLALRFGLPQDAVREVLLGCR